RALLLASLLLAGPADARGKKPRPRDDGGSGTVTFASADRAYLDKGKAEGVVPGQTLELLGSHGRAVCRVEAVGLHVATCAAPNAQGGDRFAFKPARAEAAPPTLPPLPAAKELARRRAALQAAALE